MRGPRRRSTTKLIAGALVRNVWIENELDQDWMVAYRLGRQGAGTIITEVRLFPREAGWRSPGEWSGQRRGTEAPAPEGGITARLLRVVSFTDVGRFALAVEGTKEQTTSSQIEKTEHAPIKRGRKPKWSDRTVAEIAAQYADAVASGERSPIVKIATREIGAPTIRDIIHRARRQGLLTVTFQGRGGGQLTPKAKNILRKKE
jgi:hypothetical protein